MTTQTQPTTGDLQREIDRAADSFKQNLKGLYHPDGRPIYADTERRTESL